MSWCWRNDSQMQIQKTSFTANFWKITAVHARYRRDHQRMMFHVHRMNIVFMNIHRHLNTMVTMVTFLTCLSRLFRISCITCLSLLQFWGKILPHKSSDQSRAMALGLWSVDSWCSSLWLLAYELCCFYEAMLVSPSSTAAPFGL